MAKTQQSRADTYSADTEADTGAHRHDQQTKRSRHVLSLSLSLSVCVVCPSLCVSVFVWGIYLYICHGVVCGGVLKLCTSCIYIYIYIYVCVCV